MEADIYARRLENRIEKEMRQEDRTLKFTVAMNRLVRVNQIKKLLKDCEDRLKVVKKTNEENFERKDLIYWSFLEAVR